MRARMAVVPMIVAVALALSLPARPAGAQEAAPAAAEAAAAPLTVAVLDFESKDRAVVDLGEKIGDLLTVFLSMDERLVLVERTKLKEILKEMELSASGMVDPEQATRIGGLVGAQVLVMGRAFVVNGKLYLTGKAISVETGRLGAQLAKGDLDADLDVIVQELSDKLTTWLGENADKMVAKIATPADQVAQLREALKGTKLPTMAAIVIETHVGQMTIDPAAETEVIYLMRKVGAPVISGRELKLADWAMEYFNDADLPVPVSAEKADIIILGQGFSEFAGRNGNLVTVKARVEMKALDRQTRRVLAISRKETTQVDLGEQIAAKAALQKAAGQAVVEMLPEAVAEWAKLPKPEVAEPKAEAAKPAE
jgi:hypothetical protein